MIKDFVIILFLGSFGVMAMESSGRDRTNSVAPIDSYAFTLPFRSFLTHFDASADLYLSFQQLGSYGIARWHSPRSHPGIRTAEILLGSWYHLMMGHYSHELGHDLNSEYYGDSYERSINLLEWKPLPWPRYSRAFSEGRALERLLGDQRYIKDWEGWYEFQEQKFHRVLGGLNIEQWDGRLLYLNTHDVMTWDEGMAFLSRKLSAITYDLYSGYSFDLEPGGFDPDREGDISVYLWELERRGIEQTRKQFYIQGVSASLLNLRVWESFYHGVRFWAGGPRYYEPIRWNYKNWTVTPPLVEWYLTTRGGYWNLVLPLQFGTVNHSSPEGQDPRHDQWHIVLEAGRDADQFGGDLRSKRIAASFISPSWNSGNFLWTTYAGAGLTLARGSRKWRGASWEIAESLRWQNFEWKSGLVWSRDDLLENHIKNHNNGFRWYGAVTWWLPAE